jgi:tRNA G37 N-methylase TrmD
MTQEDRIRFPDIDPPSGGTERFRERLENPGGDSRVAVGRWAAVGGVAAVLAVVGIAILAIDDVSEPAATIAFDSPEFDRLLDRPMQQVETTVTINDEPVTLSAVPAKTPGIRIYEVRKN